MPGKVIEKYWNRAKTQAAEAGHTEDWPYVMAIYQSMTKNRKKGFLQMMHGVSRIQKTAGLRDRMASTVKKVKSVYEKTEPLREEKEGRSGKKPKDTWSSWYRFKKLSGIEDIFPKQKPLPKSGIDETLNSLIDSVKSLFEEPEKNRIVPEEVKSKD